jgi:serine kinase of HPr protein (carbohydrate metabolism regulator)
VVGETGVLLRGRSGAGKSASALALIDRCAARDIFARLVADDRTMLSVAGGRLIAAPHPALIGRVERRGQGIETIPCLASATIGLVVDLVERGPLAPRLPEISNNHAVLLDIRLPRMALTGAPLDVAAAIIERLRLRP